MECEHETHNGVTVSFCEYLIIEKLSINHEQRILFVSIFVLRNLQEVPLGFRYWEILLYLENWKSGAKFGVDGSEHWRLIVGFCLPMTMLKATSQSPTAVEWNWICRYLLQQRGFNTPWGLGGVCLSESVWENLLQDLGFCWVIWGRFKEWRVCSGWLL